MTDRELLELAAKAAGLDIDFDVCCIGKYGHGRTRFHDIAGWWNPLMDDGDALRLAVQLEIELSFMNGDTHADGQSEGGPDKKANTRRAIVRAAAEIGKEKP